MRLHDDLKNSVCFIGGQLEDGRFKAGGTGFFASIPSEQHQDGRYIYVVTAKYNILNAEREGYREICLRINTSEGAEVFKSRTIDWIGYGTEGIDVAVLRFYNPPEE